MKKNTLLAKKVANGHCVIIDSDLPCTRMIAVVMQDKGPGIVVRYLGDCTNSKKQFECPSASLTPVNHFGIQVIERDLVYWCIPDIKIPHIAQYNDGHSRVWQWPQPSGYRYYPRKKSLAKALEALREEEK